MNLRTGYGMKRWAAGYVFGVAVMAAVWAASVGDPLWGVCTGIAIVAFFADLAITPPEVALASTERQK